MECSLQIAWAAGILEGEGCFTEHSGHPYILVDMTDKDVIEKLHSIFPTATIRGPYTHHKKPQNKPRWRFDAFGTKAVPIMERVLPYMCSRRTEKIKYLLNLRNKNEILT